MGEEAICPNCAADVLTSDATCHGCGLTLHVFMGVTDTGKTINPAVVRSPRCPHCPTGGLMILASKRFPGGAPVLITYMKCTNRECNTRVTAIKEE